MYNVKNNIAILSLFHLAFHNQGKNYLYVANSRAHLREAFRLLTLACHSFKPTIRQKNYEVTLANGSTIRCITKDETEKLQGIGFNGIACDELVRNAKD